MMINVRKGIDALANLNAQVCVIGSGPVGLAVAIDIARRGRPVVLIESGFEVPNVEKTALSNAHIMVPDCHAAPTSVVCRAFGGTSWLWGGRCVPLDPIDFMKRPHVPGSEWPITQADIAPFYKAASEFLACGGPSFKLVQSDIHNLPPLDGSDIELDGLERWCNEPIIALRLKRKELPQSLTVVTDATAVDLEVADGGVKAVRVANVSRSSRFAGAELFILACGGLETARILLMLQARMPLLFGGVNGPLGRYYMGHLSGHVANIQFEQPNYAMHFAYRDEGYAVTRARMALSADAQAKYHLPNVAFWPTNPTLSDSSHKSGLLSLLYLILSMPVIGNQLLPEAIREMQLSNDPDYLAHIKNVLLDLPDTVGHAANLFWQKAIKKRRKPFFFLYAADGKYPLHYHAEHIPNRESRVILADDRDQLGSRRLAIDLRFSTDDADGIVRAHILLDQALRKQHMGAVIMDNSERGLEWFQKKVIERARDGFSQIGLTRMGSNVDDGVVDADCKVFNLANLFVAGSSVFRTSGQANPTLPATALGLRLSAHIDRLLQPSKILLSTH